MSLTEEFLAQIKTKNYWTAGEKVVIGVSGGVDSMVLFHLLQQLPEEYKPALVVAHINHHLRNEADGDEAFVKSWMQKYDVPVHTYQWPRSEHPASGFEQEARNVRYRFFNEVAGKTGSALILTAHHRDDQVETVLMRFVKGSSIEELTGIVETRRTEGNTLIRPLLPYSKKKLQEYAVSHAVPWREDDSNLSPAYTRNRYRHHIIPELKKENPALEQHIYAFSNEIEELFKVVEPTISRELQRSFQISPRSMSIDLSSFLKQDTGLQKLLLRRAFKILSDQNAYIISQTHIAVLIDWFNSGGPNSTLDLPQQFVARKEYDHCRISKAESSEVNHSNDESVILEVGSWKSLSDSERIGLFSYDGSRELDSIDQKAIYLNDDDVNTPLLVRHRKPGDRMEVKGMNGSKKIKDIFIDKKTPLKKRDEAWLVNDSSGQIIWLVNYKESPLSLDPLTDTISYVLVYEKLMMQNLTNTFKKENITYEERHGKHIDH